MIKVYYQLTLHQQSPLRIGDTGSDQTDIDLMKDSRGLPFIPGSSLAGALRNMAEKTFTDDREKQLVLSLFGSDKSANKDKPFSESHVIISDATLPRAASASKVFISERDGIGLDEWGVTINKAKYDFEIVETELPYTAILEWTGNESNADENPIVLEPLMRLASKGISLGARTTRGYGNMDVEVKKHVFNFPKDIEAWLTFDAFDTNLFEETGTSLSADISADISADTSAVVSTDQLVIHMDLKVVGGFTVRVNTTDINDAGIPTDTKPLSNSRNNPVIPGTSWAGAFRHQMIDLLREGDFGPVSQEDVNHLFGVDEVERQYIRSRIRFSETEIIGGKAYSITRNSVDRFSAAPRNTALFTSAIHEGGAGRLDILVTRKEMTLALAKLLAATIFDLHSGLMTVGGEAGVGRGCMRVSGIIVNGKDCTEELNAYNLTMLED